MEQVKKIAMNNLPPMMQQNLQDLVRDFRTRTNTPDKIANKCIALSRLELTDGSQAQKAVALQKLMYLQMLGYDVSWAGFHALEVMSSPVFAHKRIGYAAVSTLLSNQPETLILTVNTCRKDLRGANSCICSIALSATARFLCNRQRPDVACNLAKQFFDDVRLLFNSSHSTIRQKTCLVAYHLACSLCCGANDHEAETMLQTIAKLLYERLDDADLGVQTAAMSSLCELVNLSKHNNHKILEPTAETRRKLESTLRERQMSVPNWLLIKLVKLFCNMCSTNSTVLTPLTALIQNTSAMSLLYECINAVISVLLADRSGGPGAIELCAQKLAVLIEDSDQNLRYLGLQAMTHLYEGAPDDLIQQPRKRRRELVLKCLEDQDDSIRRRAIQLLPYAVTKRSLPEVIGRVMLIPHTSLVIRSIIDLCSGNEYSRLSDFKWYAGILSALAEKAGGDNKQAASIVADELIKVTVTVPQCRPYLTASIRKLLNSQDLKLRSTAAFILGQYDDDDSFLYSSQKVSPELVYALLKCYIKGNNRNYQRFVQRLREIIELATGENEELQIIERCCELCALPNDDRLWNDELKKLFHESYDTKPKPTIPPELVDLILEKQDEDDLVVKDSVVKSYESFKSPSVYEDDKVYCWLELKKKDHKLIVHAQAKEQSLPDGVRLSIRPSSDWGSQLFISFRRARRLSSRHACLDFRVMGVSSPQKLIIDVFWKSASSPQEAENHCKVHIPLAVSKFLLPSEEPDLSKAVVRELKCCEIEEVLSNLKQRIPAFVLKEDRLLADTLLGQGVRISWKSQSIKIESGDKDFLISLTDEIRTIIAQSSSGEN